jgi:hypothetical protein
MVHYLAPDQVMGAIDHAAHQADALRREPLSPVRHAEQVEASSVGRRAEELARVDEAQISHAEPNVDDCRSGRRELGADQAASTTEAIPARGDPL